MAETSHPVKRMKYDMRETFDILVGQEPAERFTVHTDILTPRSRFLAAARKPEWLAGNVSKPVDLVLHEHTVEVERQAPPLNVKLVVCINNPIRDEHSLAKSFEEFGFKIKSVRCKARAARSFSYDVEFEDVENAAKALADHNHKWTLGGYFVVMCVSAPRDQMANPARSGVADTGFEAMIRLYLLADKLQDLTTANMVMDELISFAAKTAEIPKHADEPRIQFYCQRQPFACILA